LDEYKTDNKLSKDAIVYYNKLVYDIYTRFNGAKNLDELFEIIDNVYRSPYDENDTTLLSDHSIYYSDHKDSLEKLKIKLLYIPIFDFLSNIFKYKYENNIISIMDIKKSINRSAKNSKLYPNNDGLININFLRDIKVWNNLPYKIDIDYLNSSIDKLNFGTDSKLFFKNYIILEYSSTEFSVLKTLGFENFNFYMDYMSKFFVKKYTGKNIFEVDKGLSENYHICGTYNYLILSGYKKLSNYIINDILAYIFASYIFMESQNLVGVDLKQFVDFEKIKNK
jgi:hypothetical protein